MKIKGATKQWEGGGYYRLRQPFAELAKHGHETSCVMAKCDVESEDADIIVGQFVGAKGDKADYSVSHNAIVHNWWRKMYRHSALVYEMDDDPFEIEPDNPAYQVYSDPVAVDSLKHCIQIANLVTVTTPYLADRISKYNSNIAIINNHIDESLLTMERPKRDRLTIGWAGGGSHIKDIMTCAYGLKKVMNWNKDIDVHFIGADLRRSVNSPRPIRFTGWCETTTDYYKNIDFDIGIAPLKPTVFAAAKSHIKALEYAALGIPVVASDTAPYRDLVIDGVTGFLVRQDHEWGSRLRDLVNDEAMRTEMGAKARQAAAEWTIQKGYKLWETAYSSIL